MASLVGMMLSSLVGRLVCTEMPKDGDAGDAVSAFFPSFAIYLWFARNFLHNFAQFYRIFAIFSFFSRNFSNVLQLWVCRLSGLFGCILSPRSRQI